MCSSSLSATGGQWVDASHWSGGRDFDDSFEISKFFNGVVPASDDDDSDS